MTETRTNFASLKTLPLYQVMWFGTGAYRYWTLMMPFVGETRQVDKDAALLAVEGLSPAKRRLVGLLNVSNKFGIPDLYSFFASAAGDCAPQVLAALTALNMEPQRRIFSEAMALFGPTYPVDEAQRFAFFSIGRAQQEYKLTADIDAYIKTMGQVNAPENKLWELNEAFADGTGYQDKIERLIRDTPELAAWAEEIRPQVPDEHRLGWLILQLFEMDATPQNMAAWPKPYRQVYILQIFCGEVLNGGVEQFFSNSSGRFAPEVAEALMEIGVPQIADTVRKAIAMFPSPYPVDTAARRQFMRDRAGDGGTSWSDLDRKLDALTGEIYGKKDGADGLEAIRNAMILMARRENILPQ